AKVASQIKICNRIFLLFSLSYLSSEIQNILTLLPIVYARLVLTPVSC
ncbi:MAG: hypothetical protein ACI8QG_001129, partial [Flavobacteriales bacterium]